MIRPPKGRLLSTPGHTVKRHGAYYVRCVSNTPLRRNESSREDLVFTDLEGGCKWARQKIEEYEKQRVGYREAFSGKLSIHAQPKMQLWHNFMASVLSVDKEAGMQTTSFPRQLEKGDSLELGTDRFTQYLLENRQKNQNEQRKRQQKAQARQDNLEAHARWQQNEEARKSPGKAKVGGFFVRQEDFQKRGRGGPKRAAVNLKPVVLRSRMSIKSLSSALCISAPQIVWVASQLLEKKLTLNDFVSKEVAEMIVEEFNGQVATPEKEVREDGHERQSRPPVVCIMGHVDHGKTTLLDALRGTSVAEREAGGITQSIGAFPVSSSADGGEPFQATFLDTPGHALFSQMRELGANRGVTDVVVLVVDAIDGLMPQSLESIRLAQAAKLPIVVAINKCDLEGSDPDKIIQELPRHGVVTEDNGGDVLVAKISAKKKTGLDQLRTAIALTAEMQDLSAPRETLAEAAVLEARKQEGLGLIVNVIVRQGTLKVGDYVVCGQQATKVRVLLDANGNRVDTAPPSFPVCIVGFKSLEGIGDTLTACADEQTAESKARSFIQEDLAGSMEEIEESGEVEQGDVETVTVRTGQKRFTRKLVAWATDEDREAEKDLESRTVRIFLKADVKGSLAALKLYVDQLPRNVLTIEVVKDGLGDFNETDVELAADTGAILAGFGVQASEQIQDLATKKKVSLHTRNVIYNLMDDIRDHLTAHLPTQKVVTVHGAAKIQALFPLKGKGSRQKVAAGCVVTLGTLAASKPYRVMRGDKVIAEVDCETLKHFKDKVSTVDKGNECGVILEEFDAFELGDIIECYEIEEVRPQFDDTIARGSRFDLPGSNNMQTHYSRLHAAST
eukprot:g67308.t1